MSKQSVQRFEQLPPELQKILADNDVEFRVGDMFFYKGYDNSTVIKIREIKQYDRRKKGEWTVCYDRNDDYECTEWHSYGSDSFEDFTEKVKTGTYLKLDRPFEQIMEEANKVIKGEISTDVYYHNEFADAVNNESALIHRSSKSSLEVIQREMEAKKRSAEMIARAVGMEMEKRKAELEEVKKKLYGAVALFQKQVKRIMRVITTIELYLGIDEEIFQIQDGEKAPSNTPISFRQKVLFIDEEVGAHEDGGLDFRDIAKFDEWLITGKNIDIVLPEKKGMVVFRPRRNDKEYGDKWLNIYFNIENHKNTYILIRNGDCLYRIYTEKLIISDRLFPKRKELQEMVKKMQETDWESERERTKEEMEDTIFKYRNRAVLMQGLVDRTEMFHPLPVERLNIFKLEEAGDYVRFIYDDDENLLPTGRLAFWDWHKGINDKIQHGSRVVITKNKDISSKAIRNDRLYYYCNEFNTPPAPYGLYEVEAYRQAETDWLKKEAMEQKKSEGLFIELLKTEDKHFEWYEWPEGQEETLSLNQKYSNKYKKYATGYRCKYIETHLTVLYNPGDTVYGSWGDYDPHERKKRIRWRIFRDDGFVINYDQISLSDITFYLHSRVDRHNYLDMMPILKDLKKQRLQELKDEEAFADLLLRRNVSKFEDQDELYARIRECINWWKYKNQWKRPIAKKDDLALRMIEKRLLSKNYNKFQKHTTF
jgi:hypothetical protein